ncbi:hypothetical protein EON64_04545 [archaeon]|nr:MAG: hypothetical protein EON64_04545 [archaeon]
MPLINPPLSASSCSCFAKGSELIALLQLPKGPLVGRVSEAMVLWQIRTRSANREDCLSYLRGLLAQGI